VRAEDTAFEQRSSLKARGYRWDDGEGKRVKAWWLMTNDPRTELDWLRADIYGDDRHGPCSRRRRRGAIRLGFGPNSPQNGYGTLLLT
jgi:hypothetical protein